MDKFTASNGLVLVPRQDGSVRWETGWDPVIVSNALREFFAHERDVELGRWRWPENPDYVVYPGELDGIPGRKIVRVLQESSGSDEWYAVGSFRLYGDDDDRTLAAAAYLAAHSESKPWHEAKPGEVWVITTENVADEVAVQRTPDGAWQYNDGRMFSDSSIEITSARRIFPEVSDD